MTEVPFLLSEKNGDLLLKIHIQPNASKTRVIGLHGDRLKIGIAAPPVDGKANAEIVRFIAKVFHLPKRQLKIKTGLSSRQKTVLVCGLSRLEVQTQISSLLECGKN